MTCSHHCHLYELHFAGGTPAKRKMTSACYCRDGVHPLSANWHAFGSLPTIMQGPTMESTMSPTMESTKNVARVSSCSLPLRISKIKVVSCLPTRPPLIRERPLKAEVALRPRQVTQMLHFSHRLHASLQSGVGSRWDDGTPTSGVGS